MCPALPAPANDDFRPSQTDAVARHFATRGYRRGLSAIVTYCATAILAITLFNGMQIGRPSGDPVISARV
jgi:hypothetical protein